MRIIGPPSAEYDTVKRNLALPVDRPLATGLFVETILPVCWIAGLDYGVDPVGLVAQAVNETGGGRFGGAITAAWRNTCGLKIRDTSIVPTVTDGDRPLAHAQFATWEAGAVAQAQHVRAYAGAPIGEEDMIVDPRYDWVVGRHRCEAWNDLSTRWAPSPNYGAQIEAIMRKLST